MPLNTKRILDLASVIQQRAEEIAAFAAATDDKLNGSSVTAPPNPSVATFIVGSSTALLDAIAEMEALVCEPGVYLTRLAAQSQAILVSLKAINKLSIASTLEPNETISFEEIAVRSGEKLTTAEIRQVLKMAMTHYIFEEPREGHVRHTKLSHMLRSPIWRQQVGYLTEELWPASLHTLEASFNNPGSQELKHTGYAMANGGNTFWEVLQTDAERGQRMADVMSHLQSLPIFDTRILLKDLDWSTETFSSDGATKQLVDVGGGQGAVARMLLSAFPHLTCVVQDLPHVIRSAPPVEEERSTRLSYEPHDFFTQQPRQGADFYLLRSILHDWADVHALRIIRALIPALKEGASVILNEICLPSLEDAPGVYYARELRGYDLTMKSFFNSKERDRTDWERLFQEADPRFHLKRISCTPPSILSVIEFVWQSGEAT